MIAVDGWPGRVDEARHVARGTTEEQLRTLTRRRNRIAHQGDRDGRGRATITADEVSADLSMVEEVVHAIEQLVGAMPAGED